MATRKTKQSAVKESEKAVEVSTEKVEHEYYAFDTSPENRELITTLRGEKVNLRPFEHKTMTRPTQNSPSVEIVIPAATQEQLAYAVSIGYKNVRKRVKK